MNGNAKIIALLTDFGLSDVYVGVMKGAIAQIYPEAQLIDLTHQIPPQNIAAGSFCLMNAYPYFPAGTVFLAVVDPGVGSSRRAIAAQSNRGFLVGPDNGLFSGIIAQNPALAAVELTNPQYWRVPQPSYTFHGRDIFAPAAAHLAKGTPLPELGQVIDPTSLVQLPLARCTFTDNGISGCIQYIDTYGNLITNIPAAAIAGKKWHVQAAGISIPSGSSYANAAPGTPIALIGSHNWVEIAISGGNAASKLQINWGDPVQILI